MYGLSNLFVREEFEGRKFRDMEPGFKEQQSGRHENRDCHQYRTVMTFHEHLTTLAGGVSGEQYHPIAGICRWGI